MKRSDTVTAATRHHEALPHRLLAELLRQHAAVLCLAGLHQLLLGCDLLDPLDQGAVALPVITQHLLDALQLCVAERKPLQVRGGGETPPAGIPAGKNFTTNNPDPNSRLKLRRGGRRFLTGSRSGCRLAASDPTAGCPSPGSAPGRCCAPASAGTAAPPPPSPSPSPPPAWRTQSPCPSPPRAIAAKGDGTGSVAPKAEGTKVRDVLLPGADKAGKGLMGLFSHCPQPAKNWGVTGGVE